MSDYTPEYRQNMLIQLRSLVAGYEAGNFEVEAVRTFSGIGGGDPVTTLTVTSAYLPVHKVYEPQPGCPECEREGDFDD